MTASQKAASEVRMVMRPYSVFVSLQLLTCVSLWTTTLSFGRPAFDRSSDTSTAQQAKRYTINLDAPPQDRWVEVTRDYSEEIPLVLQAIKKLVPPVAVDLADVIGDGIEKYVPYPYNMEMVGIKENVEGIGLGEVVLGNIIYEVTAFGHGSSKACTSIVAEAENGTIYHARNLDYSRLADILRNMTIIVDFQQNGTTIYTGTTYAGYIGLLTGQKPHRFTVSLDERDQGDWWMNALEAMVAGTHGIASLFIRDTLANPSMDFEDAVIALAYQQPFIAPSYVIVGGTGPRQGAVITRDRIAALDIWRIDAFTGRWYLVETNYDHWEPPPSSDDRRDPAIKAMNETGRANINGPALFNVLSTPPVLNNGTSYTAIMSASIPGLYNTWIRRISSN